jgi:hypothetical protein
VGEWWKQPRPPLLSPACRYSSSPFLRWCCRYARALTDALVLYLLSPLHHCKPLLKSKEKRYRYRPDGVEVNPLRALVGWLFTSWLRGRGGFSSRLASVHTRTRPSGLRLAMRPALFPRTPPQLTLAFAPSAPCFFICAAAVSLSTFPFEVHQREGRSPLSSIWLLNQQLVTVWVFG